MPVIRQQAKVTNRPIGVARINTGTPELWQQISNNAGQIAQSAFQQIADRSNVEAVDMAEAAKREDIVTLDKNGMPKALGNLKGFNFTAQQQYKRVINNRFEQSINTEIFTQAKKLSINSDPSIPINPATFDVNMSKYIESMVNNAPDNKYKRFIQDKGQEYLAKTKISLTNDYNIYQKKLIKDDFEVNSELVSQQLYSFTNAGSWKNLSQIDNDSDVNAEEILSETNALLSNEINKLNDLVSTNIITKEEAQDTLNNWLKVSADGALNNIGTKINTKNDLQFLSAFLATGNKTYLNQLPKEFHEDLEYVYGTYINKDNESAVNKTWNSKSDNIKNVISANNEIYKNNYEAFSEGKALGINNTIYQNLYRANLGIDELTGDIVIGNAPREQIAVLHETINNQFILFKNGIQKARLRIGDASADEQLQMTRRSMVLPFINDFLIKNPTVETETLISAISTGNAVNLNQDGKDLVNFLKQTPAFTPDDAEWANGKIRAGKDEAIARKRREINKLDVIQQATDLSGRASRGDLSIEDYDSFNNFMRATIQSSNYLFSATEVNNIMSPVKISWGKGLFNSLLPDATEDMLEKLSLFISSNGKSQNAFNDYKVKTYDEFGDPIKVAGNIEILGNAMISGMSDKEITAINKEVTDRLTRLKAVNSANKEATQKQIFENEILNGNGNMRQIGHRKAVDRIFEKQGLDWRNPESLNNENIVNLLKTGGSESLKTSLIAVVNGGSFGNPNDLLMAFKWFTVLNEKVDPNTKVRINPLRVNEFLGSDSETYAKLNTIFEISRFEGTENVLQISQNLANQSTNVEFQDRLKTFFRDEDSKLTYNVSRREIQKHLQTEFDLDEEIARELAPYAKYYLYTRPNLDNLEEVLIGVAEEIFLPTKYVFSPHSNIEKGFNSMHALEAVTSGNSKPAVTHIEKELAQFGNYKLGENVYLVPHKYAGTVGVRYDAYTSEGGALVPIIINKDGEAFLPSFEFNTGSENDIMKTVEEYSGQSYNATEAFQLEINKNKQLAKLRSKLDYKAGTIPPIVANLDAGPRPSEIISPEAVKEWNRKTTYKMMRNMGMFEEERGNSLRYYDPKDKLENESAIDFVKRSAYTSPTIADMVGKGLSALDDRFLGIAKSTSEANKKLDEQRKIYIENKKEYYKPKRQKRGEYIKATSEELTVIKNITKDDSGVKARIDGNNFIFIFDGKFAGNIYNSFREKIPASEATKLWEYFRQGSDE